MSARDAQQAKRLAEEESRYDMYRGGSANNDEPPPPPPQTQPQAQQQQAPQQQHMQQQEQQQAAKEMLVPQPKADWNPNQQPIWSQS